MVSNDGASRKTFPFICSTFNKISLEKNAKIHMILARFLITKAYPLNRLLTSQTKNSRLQVAQHGLTVLFSTSAFR